MIEKYQILRFFKLTTGKNLLVSLIFLLTFFNFSILNNALESREQDKLTQKSLNSSPYIIGPGDLLELLIYGEQDLSGTFKVLNDGSISVPYSGNVNISGLSINSASDLIKKKLEEQLIVPTIQLKVVKPRPIRISVIGEIERPGIYSLTVAENSQTQGFSSLNISGLPTIVDAIQKAGGITQRANLSEVELSRIIPNQDNKYKKTKLNLLKLILDGEQVYNPYLFDGDIIKIKKTNHLDKDIVSIAQSNLSPQKISVYIVGEVNNPGKTELMSNTPLVQAILAAGGPVNWRGSKGKVYLVRINRNGSISKTRYKINLNQDVSNKKNPVLKNGDTVFVSRTSLALGSDALKAVTSPISDVITAYTLFKLIGE